MTEYELVDVFTRRPGAGNPAGVVADAGGLDAAEMQRIAALLAVSETAFVIRDGGALRIRWFTPSCEVALCGHATLAAAHVLGAAERPVRFEYGGGRLDVVPEALGGEMLYWLGRPAPEVGLCRDDLSAVRAALGEPEPEPDLDPARTADGDLLLPLAEVDQVAALRPDMAALGAACGALGIRGVAAMAIPGGAGYEVRSRFFAPHVGIFEDPVTGSAHGAIAVYLHSVGLVEHFPEELRALAFQGDPDGRGGTVWLRLELAEDRPVTAWVGGEAVTAASGAV
ncbi:MAG: PhzF family phenazine biosynthesis protein [Armatimonadetes bacterium]|nr:PhzF family phenazine biosynthesis protein [Armatimonadota bacterium]